MTSKKSEVATAGLNNPLDEESMENSGRRSLDAQLVQMKATSNPPKDAADRQLYEQGRTARLNGISKEDAPYDSEDKAHRHWLKGWESLGE